MHFKKTLLAAGATVALAAGAASAAPVTHSASSFGGAWTPAFGALADAVGTAFVGSGVDYSYGNVEGVFDDGGGVGAFCGINGGGVCDLVTDVDGQIVDTGTGLAAVTSFISVEAGYAADGSLTLSVFDSAMNLLASVLNGPPAGPNGRTTMTIDRGGVFDVAYFMVSGGDTYGVNTVTIEGPRAISPVPLPAGGLLLLGGLGALAATRRKKKS